MNTMNPADATLSIDEQINSWFSPISDAVASVVFYSVPVYEQDILLILVWLACASLFFTLYLGFANIRFFKHAIQILFKKDDDDSTKGEGQISRFQAFATSLSGTVGLGNIAGVAVAISIGGPGAAFWMFLMGFFGMSTKFSEVMLGVKYRQHTDPTRPEKVSGGPMYYLKVGFDRTGIPYLGTIMGGFFAVCTAIGTLGAGSLFQTNQMVQQTVIITGGDASFFAQREWMIGLIVTVLVAAVILGGIRSIGAVAGRLVPLMALVYVGSAAVVLAMHASAVPGALLVILTSAFSVEAGIGGLIGAIFQGIKRSSFSNEAGVGTAAIAHAAAQTDKPVEQGLVGMLGPFIDTVCICTMTALVIIVTGAYDTGGAAIEGVELTSRAFEQGGAIFPYILFLVVALFAYSTLISWSYYGVKAFTYLFGDNKKAEYVYKSIFCSFIIVGASSDLSSVVDFTDAVVLGMGIPNIIGLYLFAPEIKRELKAYASSLKSS
ncbi:MAG: alanine glycine permease [Micavibrio sp. TMED27]|nr:alanine glycine permease [Micavibrio sp.]OUT89516.1 MAG: alanine glycine permease [Micavibrio sp. TMED27]